MAIRHTIFASTFALLGIAAAHADGLQPVEGRVIDLGNVTGVVYYTPEPGGYRVVATFALEEGGAPMRFEAVLAPGQSVVLSTPRDIGDAPRAVEISRQGDQVLMQEASVTN